MDLGHLLIWLLFFCIVAGLVIYALQFLPLPQPFRNIAIVIVCLILILILLNFMGVLGSPLRLGELTGLAVARAAA